MHSIEQAVSELLGRVQPIEEFEQVDVDELCGRVLAGDVTSPVNVPPADNSAMDGYALRHADWPGDQSPLKISQRIPAGSMPLPLEPGTAARLFTGAEIPSGADTVVMQENTDCGSEYVTIHELPEPGSNIRPRAQDVRKGQVVLHAGARLRPQDAGLMASVGVAQARVFRRLKVAVLSNGNELVEPGMPLQGGQIYNSNRYLINAMMRQWGFEVIDLGIAPDEPDAIREKLLEAAASADVIVSSGGVSVGEEDHIKSLVEELGALDLWKVSIKPGKPFAFGHVAQTPFLGLPGNPASVLVTCLIIARPYLLSQQGVSDTDVVPLKVPALFTRKKAFRTEFLRVLSGPQGLNLYPAQSSGVLLSSVWGDGLAIQREGAEVTSGESMEFLPYRLLL